ncbi:MAG: hypothetical protein EGP77_00210 [Lachnospiraceae bacterium]|uniref:DUF5301 domain-containing protein n=1 Tax=Falcatimonas sp. MSJ-15 TaxID=2841515 RepID=UPI0015C0B062|nr:DUF5301 domain-containing protein [Falcatimonas sp. MSJ-15]MBD9150633.1 hypothetical protein [Lachnospiraceae bacterium]MBU5471027.1 DUF5301 domain-containing protein [Falcatimonas sp. MSJ-15]
MKKRIALYIISLIVVFLLSACSSQKVADPIVLPELGDLTSISVVSGDITATSIDKQWMADIMTILTDMESTSQSSINDVPNVEGYITINLNCSDGSVKTVFFYEENGKEYVEQPYQGIYMPASELGGKITELLESLDS